MPGDFFEIIAFNPESIVKLLQVGLLTYSPCTGLPIPIVFGTVAKVGTG
jgi:hypothetical protein